MADYDVVVLGGGSGGYACALRAAQLGLSVALVERDRLGGTCLHQGCIPTKALLHAAELADSARESGEFGVHTTLDRVDLDDVHDYRDAVVARLFSGLTGLFASTDVDVVAGEGRLVSPDTVAVGERRITGRYVVVATGSFSRVPPGVEVDGERIVTSEHALELDRLPRSVAVLGGGVIGCEFASLWRSFGAEVTVVEQLPQLLPGEDPAIAKQVQRAFRKRGIAGKVRTSVTAAERTDEGVRVTLGSGDHLDVDVLLVAVGRGPRTADLGLEAAGVALDAGFVVTDDRLRSTAAGVFAVGDVVRGPQLAHRGFAQGIFVAEEIAGLAPDPVVDRDIPRVTYCSPEVASVGLTEAAAVEEYGADAVTAVTYDLGGNGKSQILGTQGFVKLVRRTDGPVVGVHLVGARVGELVGEAQLIVGTELDPRQVARLVHAHPSQHEALGEAHLALVGKPLHAHA